MRKACNMAHYARLAFKADYERQYRKRAFVPLCLSIGHNALRLSVLPWRLAAQ